MVTTIRSAVERGKWDFSDASPVFVSLSSGECLPWWIIEYLAVKESRLLTLKSLVSSWVKNERYRRLSDQCALAHSDKGLGRFDEADFIVTAD